MRDGKKVGFAVVGLGAIAQGSVLPAFMHAKRAKLVALVGRDKGKAEKLARKYKAQAAYGAEELGACLQNPEVDAVYLATPQSEHLTAAIAAARAGKHVLCEKPLAVTAEQSAEMVWVCEECGVQLMTAYRKYYEPSALHLKNLVQSGKLGKIDVINTSFSELHVPGRSIPWLLDSKVAGGGPLMDLGVYCVNTSRWLVEEDPVEVSAHAWRRDFERFRDVEEGISFRMHFASGLVVQGASTYSSAISSFVFVQGTKGWACLTPAFPFDEERRLTGKIGGKWFEKKFKVLDEFAPELDAFAEAIGTKTRAEADGRQGHWDMIILEAIYASARSGAPVSVRYEIR
ncbi:MAG TPA: Gfo/Idh/MocA family oxidoreductase [Candidatus Sulfotelmatobacter sp.]|jgi:predicted dehydrogenase|nr:Gfo/Idh/MocA family oxidoreductase [Candidatus Sulfotelmatobacter sp.]